MSKSQPIPSQSGQDDDTIMVISGPASSNPGPPSEILLTQLLQSSAADHEAEHDQWHKNGNLPPQEDKAGGKNLDQTCFQLAIEWPGTVEQQVTTSALPVTNSAPIILNLVLLSMQISAM